LTATRTGTLRLLCAHFDTFFTLDGRLLPSLALEASGAKAALRPGEVGFTTGPRGTKTHWAQTVFLLREPIEVTEGAEVRGTMRVRKAAGNTRELVVGVALEGRKEQVWNVR
jgi:protein arginine N-methyltransferase 3